MVHSGLDHSGMDHSGMDHSGMDHSTMDHSTVKDIQPTTMKRRPKMIEAVIRWSLHNRILVLITTVLVVAGVSFLSIECLLMPFPTCLTCR